MKPLAATELQLLKQVISIPTAPFHEQSVAGFIRRFARNHNIAYQTDQSGNIVFHYKKGAAANQVTFTAHMDHPAFEIQSVQGNTIDARVYGGLWPTVLKNTSVDLYRSDKGGKSHRLGKAKIVNVPEWDRTRDTQPVTLHSKVALKLRKNDWGVCALPDWQIKGGKIYARVIDNLVNCASILQLFAWLQKTKPAADVYGVFTRAEEVGFVGASALVKSGKLPRNTVLICLEASRTLPVGAEQGHGVVLRLGDRRVAYDGPLTSFLIYVAEQTAGKFDYKFQKRLLDGGSCEAALFNVCGYPCAGMALPLANYHNYDYDKKTLAPEMVHLSDYASMLRAQRAIVTYPANARTWYRQLQGKFTQPYRTLRGKLAGNAADF